MYEWTSLRTENGSQELAFEELCCQLFRYEPPENGSRFHRKGTPDAGVECFWELLDGSEHALQAKFFLTPPSASQWGQIDKSVCTALSKHPKLTRYIVWLPIDRPDARIEGQKSMLDQWNSRKSKWESNASKLGVTVVFEYRGRSEILEHLSREVHAGRRRYWFSAAEMSQQWFNNRADESIKALQKRYFPQAHVDLKDIQKVVDGLATSASLFHALRTPLEELRRNLSRIRDCFPKGNFPPGVGSLLVAWSGVEGFLKETIEHGLLESPEPNPLPSRDRVELVLTTAATTIEGARSAVLSQSSLASDEPRAKRDRERSYQCYLSILEKLDHEVRSLLLGKAAEASRKHALIVFGDAGSGKSHLFAHMTRLRVQSGLPTLLLLGVQLDASCAIGLQMSARLDLADANLDEILGELSMAAEVSGHRAVIFIDALNESNQRQQWRTTLPQLLERVHRYGRTVVSCTQCDGKSRVMVFSKWCIGGALGGGGSGVVHNLHGVTCDPNNYKGWFYEIGASGAVFGGGVDIGYNDDGTLSGTLEGGVSAGFGGLPTRIGVMAKSTWCRYYLLYDSVL